MNGVGSTAMTANWLARSWYVPPNHVLCVAAVTPGVVRICCSYEIGNSWIRLTLCVMISRSALATSTPPTNAARTVMRKP